MTKVAIILSQSFADWEYALIAGLGRPFYGLDVQFFTPEVGQVRSQGGLSCIISQNLDEILLWSPKVVVVVGGMIWESADAPDISTLLKTWHANGYTIAGICGGTLALARAGLLNTVSHTSNDSDFLVKNAKNYKGLRHFKKSAAAIVEDRIITAPGTAPVSFTAKIFDHAGLEQNTVSQLKEMMAAELSEV